jgi:hypothetical protein
MAWDLDAGLAAYSITVAEDGDHPGHPFYGNQHIGGQSVSRMTPQEKAKAILTAKKWLQPSMAGKVHPAKIEAAKKLIAAVGLSAKPNTSYAKHVASVKKDALEKLTGIAPKDGPGTKTQYEVSHVTDPMAGKPVAINVAGEAKPTLSITKDPNPVSLAAKFQNKVEANMMAQQLDKDKPFITLPFPNTAMHMNWVAKEKGEPLPHPQLQASPVSGYHQFTGTKNPLSPNYSQTQVQQAIQNPSSNTPTKTASTNRTDAQIIDHQMVHTTRDKPLSQEQKQAIARYTGIGYQPMNYFVRGKGSGSAEIKACVANLDEAFKGAALKAPMTIFRGISRHSAKELFGSELHTGHVFQDKGFVSTSASKGFAENWRGNKGIVLEIAAEKGTPAIDVHKLSSSGEHEREILLPRDSKFEVVSVKIPIDQTTDRIHVVCKYVA